MHHLRLARQKLPVWLMTATTASAIFLACPGFERTAKASGPTGLQDAQVSVPVTGPSGLAELGRPREQRRNRRHLHCELDKLEKSCQ